MNQDYLLGNVDLGEVAKILDLNNGWKSIVSALETYKVRVKFKQAEIREFELSRSPTGLLLSKLIQRNCRVSHFKEILRSAQQTEALALLGETEPLEITVQPVSRDNEVIQVGLGEELVLRCFAQGVPEPRYQWHVDNRPLEGQTGPELWVKGFSEADEGDYWCVVTQVLEAERLECVSYSAVCQLEESAPWFKVDLPELVTSLKGVEFELKVEVECASSFKLMWVLQDEILAEEASCVLKLPLINNSSESYHGQKVKCIAYNNGHQVASRVALLQVVEGQERPEPWAKVALLIANQKYDHHPELATPINDVACLAQLLRELDFHVIPLINLTRVEMKGALDCLRKMVPRKSYILFYFSGHGCTSSSSATKFMLPTDCPPSTKFSTEECISLTQVIHTLQDTELLTLTLISDMCLKTPSHKLEDWFPPTALKLSKFSLVEVSSTSCSQPAYERPGQQFGIYFKYLKKHLTKPETLCQVLYQVHKEYTTHESKELQKPYVYCDAGSNFKLTDPPLSCPKFTQLISFINAHETTLPLPLKMTPRLSLELHPHRLTILNALDVLFPPPLNQWKIDVFTTYPTEWSLTSQGLLLTVYNIQKASSDITLTVKLSDKVTSAEVYTCSVNLKKPLIAKLGPCFIKMNNFLISR